MAIDTTNPASRRVLLAGTVSGLAALAAHALGRPTATTASTAVLLGENNSSTSTTKITNPNGAGTALAGYVTGVGHRAHRRERLGYRGIWFIVVPRRSGHQPFR